MSQWGVHDPTAKRRPDFDEVLERFAAKTGRPLWKVRRTMPSDANPARARRREERERAA